MIDTEELISNINEALLKSTNQHPHLELIKKATKGPKWHQNGSGYRYLTYEVPDEGRGGMRHIRAVYVPAVRKISSELYREVKSQGLRDIELLLQICNDLLRRRTEEYRAIAFDWCYRMKKQYAPHHFKTFEQWTKSHLTNWGSVDNFCTHTMGYFLYKHPRFASEVKMGKI